MDRAYDSQSKKFLVKETIPKTDLKLTHGIKSRPKDKTNNFSNDLSANGGQKTFSTHPLDEAMQELLDIAKQYDDKLTSNKRTDSITQSKDKSNMKPAAATQQHQVAQANSKTTCDDNNDDDQNFRKQNQQPTGVIKNLSSQYAQGNNIVSRSRPPPVASESVEMLQEKQVELQRQLDEVLVVAKKLASKQKRNLTDILEDQEDLEVQNIIKKDQSTKDGEVVEEEEDELIEFQQIENELRISELKRQLDNIQEKLRIRLFKRLVSNTGAKQQIKSLVSAHSTDESSPSASSCSSTTTSSSTSHNNELNALSNGLLKNIDIEREVRKLDVTDGSLYGRSDPKLTRSQDTHGTTVANNEFHSITYELTDRTFTPTKTLTESNCFDHDSAVDYTEALTPTTSRESVMSKKNPPVEGANPQTKDTVSPYQAMSPYVHTTSPGHQSNHRNSSANSDLERIEEDEDEQDYYRCSDKFRTIYEEKFSPKALGHVTNDNQSSAQVEQQKLNTESDAYLRQTHLQQSDDVSELILNQHTTHSSPHPGRNRVQPTVEDPTKPTKQPIYEATNRPLTLYLPKPDEEIDLIEHVQALGHDIDIISDDLKLSSKSAEGYLWKCCANSPNKWLKRYFYYDRESKIVAYFKSKSQLAKKSPSPRDTIPFEEISDVYVDHRLSSLGDKGNGSSKDRNFVFVLATLGRKYLLASSKAETMRAWIDILFTAAEANDYLEHLEHTDGDEDEDEDELDDARCNSLR